MAPLAQDEKDYESVAPRVRQMVNREPAIRLVGPSDADSTYTLTQLRYDLRKMKAHALIERIGRGYPYRLTDDSER